MARTGSVRRDTKETRISTAIDLDGRGEVEVSTGLGFLDHMIEALSRHGRFDVRIEAEGDLHIDDHHVVEDVAITLGQAVDQALGDRAGIERFGHAYVPMDEALARAAWDLSGRAFAVVDLGLRRNRLGQVATENLRHFLQSFATSSRSALHVDLLRGDNDHHRAEAAFKATGVALRRAAALGPWADVPSTKGSL
jgi:imidazoleglycerol-phosphate dehydratase